MRETVGEKIQLQVKIFQIFSGKEIRQIDGACTTCNMKEESILWGVLIVQMRNVIFTLQ
jgi:hypothetical protein